MIFPPLRVSVSEEVCLWSEEAENATPFDWNTTLSVSVEGKKEESQPRR